MMNRLSHHAIALWVSAAWTRNPPRHQELYYRARAAVVYGWVLNQLEMAK